MARHHRPDSRRPQGRKRTPGATRPRSSSPTFDVLFDELRSTRDRYEALRLTDGSYVERALLLERLHELRSDLAVARDRDPRV